MHPSLRNLAALGLLAGAAAAGLHATLVAPRSLRIKRYAVRIPSLPATFHDYRIVHLSDLHLGALSSGAEGVLCAASLHADLFAVTGDMIEHGQYAEACAHLLGSLQAPDGVVCVLGNHDHYARRTESCHGRLVDLLAARGVRTLVNEAVPVQRAGSCLWLVGVDDPYEHRDDLRRAFTGVPDDEPAVLLAHSPDIMGELPPGRAGLVLTGHCHGGQVRTPWGPVFTRTRRRFPDVLGLQMVDGTPVHMSGGLGSTIPLRFLCPPEVTVLHLVSPEA